MCLCSQSSSTELLQKVCVVVKRGLGSLARGAATLLPQDFAFMQVDSRPVTHSDLTCLLNFSLTFTEFVY